MRRLTSKDILELTDPGDFLWFQVDAEGSEFSFFRYGNRVSKVIYCANIPNGGIPYPTWIVETTRRNICKLLTWYRHYRHLGPRDTT